MTTSRPPLTAEDVLRAAAAYMREHGRLHCNTDSDGGAWFGTGPCCPGIAIQRVGGDSLQISHAARLLKDRVGGSIVRWNAATADDAEIFRVMEGA